MRSAAAGSGLQAERRAFGCGTEGGGRHGRGPRLSAAGLEGRRRGGGCLYPADPWPQGLVCGDGWTACRWAAWWASGVPVEKEGAGWTSGSARWSRRPGPWPRGANGSRLRAQTQADAGIRILPAVCSVFFFFFFLRKRQLLPKERSHICLRTVIGLSCNLIREGAVAPPRPLFPFFFVSGSVRGFLAF